ncbi:hypothetical protein D9M71_442490 [compost metagenome]
MRQLHGQFVELLEGNLAQRGGFQGLGGNRIGLGVHAGHADQLAGQVETGDLLFAAIGDAEGLQRAGAHGEQRGEGVALAEQELPLLKWPATLDDVVQRVHVFEVQRQRQAQGGETAFLAVCLRQVARLDGVLAGCHGGVLTYTTKLLARVPQPAGCCQCVSATIWLR